jgi:diguanylate cyclase (GGDEF)-like protein
MAVSFDRQTLGMRVRDHARWVGLVMVAGLVPLGLGAVVLIRESDRAAMTEQDARLAAAASSEAAALEQSLGRARALLRLSSASPVWRDAVTAPGPLTKTIAAEGRPMRRVHEVLVGLRAGYGRRLAGVADAIDDSGREFAVERPDGPAPITLLAGGETRAPFFWPSMSLPVGAVYQTEPYISPDTHRWVISSSTTALVGEYDRVVIQLEVPIESLRREALARGRGADVSVIDARTGLVVFDSTHRQRVGATLALPDLHGVRRVIHAGPPAGLGRAGGRRIAYRHLPQVGANANDWYVVVDAPHPPALRPTRAAQFVLALMVLALGGLGLALGRQSAAVRREAERTAHQAMHDELTGLPNRLLFRDRTERAIAAAHREGIETAVLLMDVDGFREINDTLGHHAGDRVIAAVAARLRGVLRSSDTLARLGGDEFAILLPRIMEESDAVQLAGRVRTALASPLVLRGVPLDIRASIGIAAYPEHGDDVDSLLQHAEIAMYVAKDTRTSMQVYDPSTDDHSTERLALVGELRHALDRNEIVVHYQPKATMWDGRVRSVEALVRWQHPERGLIGPYEFVHLAEHTGLIRPLTHHVLRVALEQCRAWRDRGLDLSVAVNLSVRDLVDLDLPGAIAAELDRFGLEPRFLGIEITETMLVLDPNRTIEVLARLHEMGVRISLDDFGTGYSSLSYLQRLPVDELKIDRSFIRGLTGSETDTSIVEATVALARKLGLATVAEGVECADTWERLLRLGCDVAQGYFISRPLPAEALEAWLAGADRHAAMADHPDA